MTAVFDPATESIARQSERALDAYSATVVAVAERLATSVANVRVSRRTRRGVAAGAGSAVVIATDGYLLTSAHVVERARGGTVGFGDGRELRFSIVGSDPLSDLAVLRADGGDLVAAELGEASALRVGQLVVAIGNPNGFGGSVTTGVVSGLGRSLPVGPGRGPQRLVENVIQTDAALNPGNSGGALADGGGRVVGINTAVAGVGLGLAVPINDATREIVSTLIREGRVDRAQVGIAAGPAPLPPAIAKRLRRERGIAVLGVVDGGPADRAGIHVGDVLVELDGQPLADATDLQRMMVAERIGRPLLASVLRAGELSERTIVPTPLRVD
ncbi:MAG TPA: trypsin-like peptidase domain-containing protein [Solirubrobacteraceae bacterium]|jgi:S1-C subfamily serine protease|nr:trypsin-like peptidase domain-containing protein [Solirubrobacteraceae bacterium]